MVYEKTQYERPVATELQLECPGIASASYSMTNEGFTPDEDLIEI